MAAARLYLAAGLALGCHLLLFALPGVRMVRLPEMRSPQRVAIRLTAPVREQESVPVVAEPEPVAVEQDIPEKKRVDPVEPVPVPLPEIAPRVKKKAVPEPVPVPEKVVPLPREGKAEPAPAPLVPASPSPDPLPARPVLVEAVPLYQSNPRPRYPERARRRGIEGTVMVEAHVSQTGTVEQARVAVSSGHRELDRAALAAVGTWLFVPGRRGSEPLAMWVRIPVRFQLKEAGE